MAEELSNGLSFHQSTEVFHNQIAKAAYIYCGKTPPAVPDWALAFNRDPNQLAEPASGQGHILVNLESPEELIENYRSTTNLVADVYGQFKSSRRGKSESFNQEVEFQEDQLLLETFLPPQIVLKTFPQLDDDLGKMGSIAVSQMQRRLSRILMEVLNRCPNPGGFWGSQELLECPYLKIRASLMAADIFFNPQRTPEPSLNTDFDIMASVLPYVDIVATERYMSGLIRQSKLFQDISVRVYSMRQREQLLEALENL